MSVEAISILALVAIFLLATVLPVHMGALALVAAFIVGTTAVGESTGDIVAGFPGDLFLILVGVTLLFAIAKDNGTVDWLVSIAVNAVGGRVALIPWVMFGVTGLMTSVGAVVPAAVAIIAPVGMGFALRYGIKPVLMGLMIINGASAGGFSPLSIFGSIVNGVVERNGLPGSPLLLFLSSMLFNLVLGVVVFVLFGGRALLGQRDVRTSAAGGADTWPDGPVAVTRLDRNRILTLIGIAGLAIGALFYRLDVGFMAITVAVLLSLAAPNVTKNAVNKVAWSDRAADLRDRDVRLADGADRHDRLSGQQRGPHRHPALRRRAHLLHRRRRVRLRLDDRHPRCADPAGRTVPPHRRGWRCRVDHRPVDLVIGGRLQPVLNQRGAGGGALSRRPVRPGLQGADGVGLLDGRHRPTGDLAVLRCSAVAVGKT